MKKISILAMSFLAAGVIFTSCESDSYKPAEPITGCYEIYFPEQDAPLSGAATMDPEDPTTFTYVVGRLKTEGAIEVPYTLSGDTDYFTVTPSVLSFADGAASTTLTVSFPNAAIGKSYAFGLTIDNPDNKYVNPYTKLQTYIDLSVLRARWVTVDEDKSIFYYGMEFKGYEWYTDDLLISLFGEDPITYPVQVQVREDTIDANYPYGPNGLAGLYRMINAYGENYPYNEPGDYRTEDVYITLDARDPDAVVLGGWQDMGVNWGYGWMMVVDYATYSGDMRYAGWIEDGAIYFGEQDLVITDDEGPGWGNPNGGFELVINQDIYNAAHAE